VRFTMLCVYYSLRINPSRIDTKYILQKIHRSKILILFTGNNKELQLNSLTLTQDEKIYGKSII